MKRNIFYIAMACMMVFVSCKKENGQQSQEGREVEFGATVDESDGSKTYLDGTSVLWADGDQISVNGSAINLVAGAGYKYGTFRGKVTPYNTESYYVGYPASATTFDAGTMTVAIPAAQTYNAQTLLGQMPMAAYIEGSGNKMTLHFKNAVNLLKINLTGTAGDASKVTRIEITSTVAPLTGKIAVTANGTDNVTFGTMSETGNTITLDCGTGIQLTDEPTAFYVIIPKISEATTLNVRTYCANGAYQQNTINANATTFSGSNQIYATQPKEVNAAIIDGALPGEFSVSATKKVKFSQGNLQYIGSASPAYWKFADNQWDYFANTTSQSIYYPASGYETKDRDLFAWGCTGSPDLSYPGTSSPYYYYPYNIDADANASHFGPVNGHNLTVSNKSDWGWLRIKNGGDVEYSGWFTLSKEQYDYLLGFSDSERTNADNLREFKTLDGTKGLVILPDGTDASVMSSITSKADLATYNAVFLPAAGYVYTYNGNPTVGDDNVFCDYWSCSYVSNTNAYYLLSGIGSSGIRYGTDSRPRNRGYAVRLVRDASNGGSSAAPFIGGNW